MIRDNPELADELEAKIMEALKATDNSPMARARREQAAPAADEPGEAPAAKPAQTDLFDDELPDDGFSIEEDL